ncbi:MAG: carbon-nitrogen hydrolase family protein [Bacteroides sp.]|nr:carbon-nitrogen hydrolase family protein [Bacteroides sp.]
MKKFACSLAVILFYSTLNAQFEQSSDTSNMRLASALDIWVILGSIHELGEGFKPMNSLYVINPDGMIEDRYDKRFCTEGDLEHFSAGEHFSVVNIQGIKCGFLICFDVRFPELYREYKKLDVDFIFQSFYNARQKPGGIIEVDKPGSL